MRISLSIAGAALLLGGCMHISANNEQGPKSLLADLRTPDGLDHGRATLTRTTTGFRLAVEAGGMTPGAHGIHIHTVGKCDAPDFKTAGAHWNPTMKMHGRDNPKGAHSGDLINLMVGTNGSGTLQADVSGDMASLMDEDGSAIVIHAKPDDYKTDPSGNSGDRLACGVFAAR